MTQPGTEVMPANQYLATGMEDIDPNDLRMPRLSIDKEDGTFVNSMTNDKFEYMTAIALGVIKQRVLWQAMMGEGDLGPMCKSPNAKEGYPTLEGRPEELFPWPAAGFSPEDFPLNAEGRKVLPCANCRLSQWKSHPDGKKAWCSEQWTIPILYGAEDDEPLITALLTAQRSSLAGAKGFFGGLFQRQQPAFSTYVKIGLQAATRGKNKYYVPTWAIKGSTDQEEWPLYSQSYLTIRYYVSKPPRGSDEVNAAQVGDANVIQGSVQQQTWAPGQPLTTTVPVTQPVVAQSAPVTAPVAPAAQPAPVASPMNQTARDFDDLPF
jgi:hypothetical protein